MITLKKIFQCLVNSPPVAGKFEQVYAMAADIEEKSGMKYVLLFFENKKFWSKMCLYSNGMHSFVNAWPLAAYLCSNEPKQ